MPKYRQAETPIEFHFQGHWCRCQAAKRSQCLGTAIALDLKELEEEFEMFTIIQVFLGFVVGCIGFMQIAEHPIQGCSALLLSGFIILAGLDRSHHVN
jgi:hypothetical protein